MYPTMPTTRWVDATIGGVGDGDDIQVGRRRRGYDVYERLVIVVVCCRGCWLIWASASGTGTDSNRAGLSAATMHDLIVHRRCSDTAPSTVQICAGPTGHDQPATTTTSTTSTTSTSTPHWSPSSSFSSSYLLVDDLPNHIHNLFEEWGQPIPIGVEYLV